MKVQVADILRGSGVSKEDASEVVLIDVGAWFAGAFDTHADAKHRNVAKVGIDAVPSFVGGTLGEGMNMTVVDEYGVDEGNIPILCREADATQ